MIHWNAIVLKTETCSMATIFPVSNISSQIIDKFTSRDLKFKWFGTFLRILETRIFFGYFYKNDFLFIIMAFCNVTSFRDEFQPGELLFFQIISIIYTIMGIVSLICIGGQAQGCKSIYWYCQYEYKFFPAIYCSFEKLHIDIDQAIFYSNNILNYQSIDFEKYCLSNIGGSTLDCEHKYWVEWH